MTDTGQVPGEGLPENAGMVEQPGVPGAYTYLSETPAEDEDLLLPGAQSPWGNEVAPPLPEPVVETVHEPGPHEMAGRDSGAHDLSAVRTPRPQAPSVPIPPITPRRPLHLGPPIPDSSASPVRSLADRGPAGAPVRQPVAAGPEYLEASQPQGAVPWGAPGAVQTPVSTVAPAAETVVPAPSPAPEPVGAAQAAVARLASEAEAGGYALPQEAPAAAVPETAHEESPAAETAAAADLRPDEPQAVSADAAPVLGEKPGAGLPAEGDLPGGSQSGEGESAPVAGAEEFLPDGGQPGADPAAAGEFGAEAQVPDGGSSEDAVQDVAEAGEGAQAPGAGAADSAAGAQSVPVVEGEQVGEAAEPAHVLAPEAVVPDGQAAEAESATGGPEAASETAPEAAPLPETVAAPETDAVPETAAAAEAGVTPEAVALPEAGAGAQPETIPVPEVPEVPEASALLDAAASEAVPVEGVAVPSVADAAQDGGAAPETVPAQSADGAQQAVASPEADAPQEAVPAPEAGVPEAVGPETVAPETAPPAQEAAPVITPDASEAVPLQEPADTENSPQSTETPALAGAAPAAEQPEPPVAAEPLLAEAAPEHLQEPARAGHVEEPLAPAPDFTQPVPPQGPAVEPATAPVQDAPQAVVADAADTEVPLTDAAAPAPAPADEAPLPAAPESPVQAPQGPQPAPQPLAAEVADAQPQFAVPGTAQAHGVLPSVVPMEPQPGQPLGEFVPVDGSVPTTPHLAPTPPQPVPLPAPREADGDAELVQQADDLDTRAADQEDQEAPEEVSTAPVAEARQSTGPAAPAYDDAEREAVLKVMRERRDIRNGFRSDPIPHEVLLRVLEAAHTAPSVGHSQPWDFVVIRSAETRGAMHELAQRQRDAYAKSLPKGRAKQFKELKIEAILDTPVNIVVTADPTRGGRHTLGRHTQPQMAPYSAALAVENLWLAARAEGLGVGWVSFFDEREMVRALGLPEHLEVIAYLCVGYVDEFPDEPELMQAGWSKRRPLSWVVHEETYGRRALPGEEPHDLLGETVAQIRPLDAKALGEAWERQKRMTKPAGALGMLEIISAQLSGLSRQCPPPIPEPAAVAIFAGDHGVHAQGVTPWPQEVTAQMVANFLGGGAVCNAFAGQVGAEVCVVDVGVAAELPATPGLLPRKIRAGTSDMTTGPAMTREEAKQAIEVGIETARDLVAAGNKALLTGEMGIANTTASAALISVFTGTDPAEVTGRGTGINDETLARKTEVVRRAIELHQPDPADPIGVLAAIGGFEHAAMVGLLLGGASLRTPVILDGVSAGAAALVARAIAPEVLAACIAGHRSAEPGHVAALNKLGLRPLVDLDLRLGEGTGALLALPLVQSTARAMHEVATFDSAGVTEK
ncbi:nicotinate-nucleotide--dimethylbenzimidazole phosphoribosyltransferase [Streptomyces griseorubiginosus]|uniref:nicotinate-nucleotide--dimethylbenzimidazole phosphoribosyltransferase n=1 Tax=Streptomyces griseorubiginosus TaxID=67304 RepID=UPI002E81E51C|nr:nicotinate-nucleotide--dimethylbenzimidazole phosphoribosyltransferase [Streptomyces griseorubiginosus]WUB48387.1 nicotinate-nucleotide--dimethylbenzimidazole phosphoribosyltransferase [Streptomyces griseorubiginosus]WUB56913.1 nicotinate-nucleotide--dimethylbenzimidazole phosphoribosyltransferase [Streptomyces griseorubiginosus]